MAPRKKPGTAIVPLDVDARVDPEETAEATNEAFEARLATALPLLEKQFGAQHEFPRKIREALAKLEAR